MCFNSSNNITGGALSGDSMMVEDLGHQRKKHRIAEVLALTY